RRTFPRKHLTMIKAIVLPADPDAPVRVVDLDEISLRAGQRLVGGPIEPVDLTNPDATLYLNENGKIHDLPRNFRATLVAWTHVPVLRGRDVILGDAYLTGPLRRSLDTDAPTDLVTLLTGHAPTVVQTCHQPDVWLTDPSAYDDPFDAYLAALAASYDRETLDVRVVPGQDSSHKA
nr:DUF3846 domain-containing protein [Micromonospora sp. DSM 115978]